jgi:hypothetical protein
MEHRDVAEPTPWFTGLAVTGLSGFVVCFVTLTLMFGFGSRALWLGFLAGAVVAAGLTPSMVLLRRVPGWRWAAYGAALGLVVGWLGWVGHVA